MEQSIQYDQVTMTGNCSNEWMTLMVNLIQTRGHVHKTSALNGRGWVKKSVRFCRRAESENRVQKIDVKGEKWGKNSEHFADVLWTCPPIMSPNPAAHCRQEAIIFMAMPKNCAERVRKIWLISFSTLPGKMSANTKMKKKWPLARSDLDYSTVILHQQVAASFLTTKATACSSSFCPPPPCCPPPCPPCCCCPWCACVCSSVSSDSCFISASTSRSSL